MREISFASFVLSGAIILLAPSAAFAEGGVEDLIGLADNLNGQFRSVSSIGGMAAFLMGFFFGIAGLMRLKANAANPNDPSAKVSTGFTLILVGSALMVVPTVLGVGVGTLFGESPRTLDLNRGGDFISLE